MASFPGSIYAVPSFGTNMSDVKTHTTWRDEITDEVRAIEIELGTTPSGASSTVAARFGTVLPLAGGTLTGQVSGITPTLAAHLARKDYVDTKLSLAGGTMTGHIVLPSGTPTSTQAVRKDHLDAQTTLRVATAGDTMTGQLLISAGAGATPVILRTSTNDPKADFQNTSGVRFGYVQGDSSGVDVFSAADIVFFTDNTQRARMDGGTFLIGKSLSNLATTGVEIHMSGSSVPGSVRSTTSAASIQNYYARHEGSANANGEAYHQFTEGTNVLGSISQVNATGVAYNVTSDGRLKLNLGLGTEDGLDTVSRIIVRRYRRDDGTEHTGVFAQELDDVIPQAVTRGGDDPHTDPWQVDYSNENIIGHLLLAVQQLEARVSELEAA